MKKGIVILSLIAAIGMTAFALFKVLTNNDHGKEKPETNPEITGSEAEAQSAQGSEAP